MKDKSIVIGRIISDQGGQLELVQSGFQPNKLTKVNKDDIESMEASSISMMPGGMINTMNAEELKDLVAYFVSQGNPNHPVYNKSNHDLAKLDIKIISAVYGATNNPSKQVDVTKTLQERIAASDYGFKMTNTLAGKDPAPGVVKSLVIKYTIKGKPVTKTVLENSTIPWE